MLDINFIRGNVEIVKEAARKKRIKVDVDKLINIDEKRRKLLGEVEEIRNKRNIIAKSIGTLSPEKRQEAISQGKELKQSLEGLEPELKEYENQINDIMLMVPGIPHPSVPEGVSDEDNVELRKVGEIPEFDFELKDHIELAHSLDIVDFERASKFAGGRSYLLKNEGALLEQAICRYVVEHIIKKGFSYHHVPVLVKDIAMFGTGFFPLGVEDTYRMEKDELNLVGTSEVSLVSTRLNEILSEDELPLRFVGLSPCFRREAGSYGKDTKGFYRVHQFTKVEQVVISKNCIEGSEKEHNFILNNAEEIMQALKLPYRVALACTGEIGLGQVMKHEIETWMPSRNFYCETHSCSTLHEFQARRLNIRYRDKEGKIRFVHTLNNTAIASPRILIPILEMNQQKDGSVVVPEVLRPYMMGIEVIEPK
ncbi:MAG: serine--tRNA ligase [Pseudomonadota bacterium]